MSASDSGLNKDELREFRRAVAGASAAPTEGFVVADAGDAGWRSTWDALVEIGATSLCIAETFGGAGDQIDAARVAAAQLGSTAFGGPYAGHIAAGRVLSTLASGGDERVRTTLEGMVAGDVIATFARTDHAGIRAIAVDGAEAATVIVAQAPDGTVRLAGSGSWTATTNVANFDVVRPLSDLVLDDSASVIGNDMGGAQTLGLLVAADTVGALERAIDVTVAYATERIAFGTPIGGFQAVQHRLADHAVRTRGLRLLVDAAASASSQRSTQRSPQHGADAARRIALAEAAVAEAAQTVLNDLLQLTGGIGFTWEYGLHFLQRRVHANNLMTANPRRALRTLAAEEGWVRG